MQQSQKTDRMRIVFVSTFETACRPIELGRKDARKVLAEAGIGFESGQPPDSAKCGVGLVGNSPVRFLREDRISE